MDNFVIILAQSMDGDFTVLLRKIELMQIVRQITQSGSAQGFFKGTVPRDWYLSEGLNILFSTFCVYADDVQGLSKAFHYCKHVQLVTFYLLL
jgi:hypothetical protein